MDDDGLEQAVFLDVGGQLLQVFPFHQGKEISRPMDRHLVIWRQWLFAQRRIPLARLLLSHVALACCCVNPVLLLAGCSCSAWSPATRAQTQRFQASASASARPAL